MNKYQNRFEHGFSAHAFTGQTSSRKTELGTILLSLWNCSHLHQDPLCFKETTSQTEHEKAYFGKRPHLPSQLSLPVYDQMCRSSSHCGFGHSFLSLSCWWCHCVSFCQGGASSTFTWTVWALSCFNKFYHAFECPEHFQKNLHSVTENSTREVL